MECPGLAGLWRQCPRAVVGFQSFERDAILAVAVPLAVLVLVVAVAFVTLCVAQLTEGVPIGVRRRTTDRRASREERIERARRHLARSSRTSATLRLLPLAAPPGYEPPAARRAGEGLPPWRRAEDDERAASLGLRVKAIALAEELAPSASALALRGRDALARAAAATAARTWLVPSVQASLHAAVVVGAARAASAVREGRSATGAASGDLIPSDGTSPRMPPGARSRPAPGLRKASPALREEGGTTRARPTGRASRGRSREAARAGGSRRASSGTTA